MWNSLNVVWHSASRTITNDLPAKNHRLLPNEWRSMVCNIFATPSGV